MLDPIGVECRSMSSSSSVLLELGVLSAVLTVLTCHSMKLLDLGKWGEGGDTVYMIVL